MRGILLTTALSAILLSGAVVPTAGAAGEDQALAAALEQATTSGKLVLLDFFTEW